jgi:hypothetical protein
LWFNPKESAEFNSVVEYTGRGIGGTYICQIYEKALVHSYAQAVAKHAEQAQT